MGLKDFKFIFDNPQAIYFSGQTISGRLLVNVDTPKKINSIMVKFKGEAEVHWSESHTERRNGKSHTVTKHFRGHELYFENKIKVFGGSGNAETLPPGEHWYPFRMDLPHNLPSSFEGTHGHVRYTIKATMDRPWKFDHEAKVAFTILSHSDLNLDPRNREPFKAEDNKYFCCCCCKSGPLTLATRIPARGYVPGQTIPLTVEIDNASNVRISEVVVELQKNDIFHASSPHRKSKKCSVVAYKLVLENSAVGENDSKTWTTQFNIPPLPPSDLPHCSIIDLEYKLKVRAKPEGPHVQLKNSFPIVIGTIPLWHAPAMQPPPQPGMAFPSPQQPMHMPMPMPSAPTGMEKGFEPPPPPFGSSMMPSAPPYPDMPPPSYEECMFGTTSISDPDESKYMFGGGGYNPRYPTYKLPAGGSGGWVPPKQ